MIARNVEARVLKLEALQHRPDEIFVIWRQPGSDVRAAVSEANLQHGAHAICAEWFGKDPLPKPQWFRNIREEMNTQEYEYIFKSVERSGAKDVVEPGFTPSPLSSANRLQGLSDNDLILAVLGVET